MLNIGEYVADILVRKYVFCLCGLQVVVNHHVESRKISFLSCIDLLDTIIPDGGRRLISIKPAVEELLVPYRMPKSLFSLIKRALDKSCCS